MESQPKALDDVTLSIIARLPEFGFLSREDISALTQGGITRYERDETVIRAGSSDSNSLLVLLVGACRIESNLKVRSVTKSVPVATVHAPVTLGEIGIFSSLPRTASVTCLAGSSAMVIPGQLLKESLRTSKEKYRRALLCYMGLGMVRVKLVCARFERALTAMGDFEWDDRKVHEKLVELKDSRPDVSPEAVLEVFDQLSVLLSQCDKGVALTVYFGQLSSLALSDIASDIRGKFDKDRLSPGAARLYESSLIKRKPIKEVAVEMFVRKTAEERDLTSLIVGLESALSESTEILDAFREQCEALDDTNY